MTGQGHPSSMHFWSLQAVLSTALMAQSSAELPLPGAPPGFAERVSGYLATEPIELWRKELKRPILSAVVEIVGEMSREEKQQLAFEDMRRRLLAEIKELLKGTASASERSGGAGMINLAQIRF